MTANYLPIFRAKKGEFDAVANSKGECSRRMLPLFEIPRITNKVREKPKYKNCEAITCEYLNDVAQKIASVRKNRDVMVDISQWDPGSLTETKEHVLPYIYSKLKSLDTRVIPVVGFDSWESATYRNAMQGVEIGMDCNYCLRLDSGAIEDAGDPVFVEERVLDILSGLGIEHDRCSVLLDFGDITAIGTDELIERGRRVMQILGPMGFKYFATAGCSLPPSISSAVKTHNSVAKIERKEMVLWRAMRVENPNIKWLYGDYGVRGPNSADDIIAPDMNGKIRYTIDQNYYVSRGQSVRKGDKYAQMFRLARDLVSSPHFMNERFSWGDRQILLRSQVLTNANNKRIGPGNATSWIAFDTNHHIAWIVAEVEEFELKLLQSKLVQIKTTP